MHRYRLLFALLLLLLAPLVAAQVQVRVLLAETETFTLELLEGHRGTVDGSLRFSTALPLSWPLAASGDTVLVDGVAAGESLAFETDSGLVSWDGESYRGALLFIARDSRLLVINRLDVEDYLRGVVPAEMQASWPAEALRAQAIAARSYVLNSLSPVADYDICASTDCQVYRGISLEHPDSDRAIADTRGLVLTYAGGFARTYYHSDSGGVLASSSEVWGENLPYLQARADVAADTPHREWHQHIAPAELAQQLRLLGHDVGTPRSLEVTSQTSSGRVWELKVSGTHAAVSLSGSEATRLLRGVGLKSTRLVMTGPLSARGDGWGHGVGMSQYGARSLALAGYAFDDILAFYYPDTQLSRLSVVADSPH